MSDGTMWGMGAPRSIMSIFPMNVRQHVRRYRFILPKSLDLLVPDTELRHHEEKERRHVFGKNLLCLSVELFLLTGVGRLLDIGDDLVEGRVLVIEVIGVRE